MIDFRKKLDTVKVRALTDPIELYGTLDRASDKGLLRPIQNEILGKWNKDFRSKHDVLLKLNTGQGKTLIGLLILLSKIHETRKPALYLCPNKYLVEQTIKQADEFGIPACKVTDGELPSEFCDSKKILVTTVQKLFNGLTKFGLGNKSMAVDSIVIDDAHASVAAIRDAFTIKANNDTDIYKKLISLFGPALQQQGLATFKDIESGMYGDFLPVPYWDWNTHIDKVIEILSDNKTDDSIKFRWEIMKGCLESCQCFISGTYLEITPYLPPIDLFGTYWKAAHKVFMSATITNDAFLIKGLQLPPSVITTPLKAENESWAGEKMILIPSLMNPDLNRSVIVERYAIPKKRSFGVAALVPSFAKTNDWKAYGATVITRDNIDTELQYLKNGQFENPLVFVNRYDGIDLPDRMCRILIFDSQPFSDSLSERYMEQCIPDSDIAQIRLARTIEQGLGRGVRGEKDYCVIVMVGPDLVKAIRTEASRKYLSNQTKKQIEIGLQIVDAFKEESGETAGSNPTQEFVSVLNQCLSRDPGWKDFYSAQMDTVIPDVPESKILDIFALELRAERKFLSGDATGAINILQTDIIDALRLGDACDGWYLQEMARYKYTVSKTESASLQIAAHNKNHSLLKSMGMRISKLESHTTRLQNIKSYREHFPSAEEFALAMNMTISEIAFGIPSAHFERAIDEVGKMLGFATQRPDKEWGAGPDNLWHVDGTYLLIECKNEVDLKRAQINKDESGQMNNSCAWFERTYGRKSRNNLLIIPTRELSHGAGFNEPTLILRDKGLRDFTRNLKAFFSEPSILNAQDLSGATITRLLQTHELTTADLFSKYAEKPRAGNSLE